MLEPNRDCELGMAMVLSLAAYSMDWDLLYGRLMLNVCKIEVKGASEAKAV